MKLLYSAILFISIFCIVILGFYVNNNKRMSKKDIKKVLKIFYILVLASVVDWGALMVDGVSLPIRFFHSSILFLKYSIGPFVFLACADLALDKEFKLRKLLIGLFHINVVVQFLSILTRWSFWIDENNIKHTGPFIAVANASAVVAFVYMVYAYYCLSKKYKHNNYIVLCLIGVLEVISLAFQHVTSDYGVTYIGTMFAMILMYIYMDDYKKLQKDKKIAEQMKIQGALAVDFECVYDVRCDDLTFSPIRVSELIDKQLSARFKADTKYDTAIRAYCSLNVYDRDKEMFLEKSSMDVVLKELEDKRAYVFEYRVFRDKEIRYFSMRAVRVDFEDSAAHMIVAFEDVDDQKNRWENLVKMSNTDQMTGLYNRRAYNEELERLDSLDYAEKSDYTCIMVDLNGLKKMNDSLGHKAGDELIIASATLISKTFDKYGMCFRLGGDEFVVIGNMTREDADRLINEYKESMRKWKGVFVKQLSASIGCARVDEFEEDTLMEDIIKRADTRMYSDKQDYYKSHDRRGAKRNIISEITSEISKVIKG